MMTKLCSKCKKPAVTYIRYNGTHLCKDHFLQYVERRVKKDIKKQGKTEQGCTIGVALSGGKDSVVALHLAHDIYAKRTDTSIVAITVDEGIQGYRNKSISIAADNCSRLGIEHHIVSFETTIGTTMDKIARKKEGVGECSYCGVFRRFCLNVTAKNLEIDRLVTGHNLDDMAQSILMNFVNGDMQRLARLGPHHKIQPGLVPRLMPLRTIPEKETTLYAILKHTEYFDGECPYAIHALRGEFRDILDTLEYKTPGTRHSILNSYESIRDVLYEKYPPGILQKCSECGEPTSQKKCKACVLKETLV